MLPIMGVAFGVGLGDRKIILNSLIISILGTVTAVVLGFLISWGFHHLINIKTNAQVINRTAPRLIDLFAALATGLGDAFATGRRDISDTLPEIAIAISLVLPLANVGILLAFNRLDLAMGSLLLFVTNYLAILLTGAFMFSMMGITKAYYAYHSLRTMWTAVAFAVILFPLILLPLLASSYKTIQGNIIENRITVATKNWLANSDYRFVSVDADIELDYYDTALCNGRSIASQRTSFTTFG